MGSLDPDVDMKQDFDDSGCVQDDAGSKPAMEEYRGSANMLDLSDDVLLYILKNLSAQDLKSLGFTCSRLGALILDHTLWVDVDASDVPHGRKRMRWMLMRVLGPHTRSLRLTGYAEHATGCLGFLTRYDKDDSEEDAPTDEERYLCEGSSVYKVTRPAPRCDNRFPFWVNAVAAARPPTLPVPASQPPQYAVRPEDPVAGPSQASTSSAGPSTQLSASTLQLSASEPSTQPSASTLQPSAAGPSTQPSASESSAQPSVSTVQPPTSEPSPQPSASTVQPSTSEPSPQPSASSVQPSTSEPAPQPSASTLEPSTSKPSTELSASTVEPSTSGPSTKLSTSEQSTQLSASTLEPSASMLEPSTSGPTTKPSTSEPSPQPSAPTLQPSASEPSNQPSASPIETADPKPSKQTGKQPRPASDRPLPSRAGSSQVLAAGSQCWQVTSVSPSTSGRESSASRTRAFTPKSEKASTSKSEKASTSKSEKASTSKSEKASTSKSEKASISKLENASTSKSEKATQSSLAEPSTSESPSPASTLPSASGPRASASGPRLPEGSAAGPPPAQAAGLSPASRNLRRMFIPPPRTYSTSNTTCPGPQLTFTHTGLRALTVLCPNLTTLELDRCVIDCQTTNIGQFPKSLVRLSLRGTKCYNMESKTFLFKIQDHLGNLEEIDVSFCLWIEPACMLPLSKMINLLKLSMRECPKLTEFVAYASLATRYGFKKLKVLDLRGSPVGDSEVSALGWLPTLEELYLSPSPRKPLVPEHAHYKQDVLPEFKELADWEETDPEYFRVSDAQENEWVRDEESAQGVRNRFYNCEDPTACILLERMIAEPVSPAEYTAVYHRFLASQNPNVPITNPEQYRETYRNYMARSRNPYTAGYSLVLRSEQQMREAMRQIRINSNQPPGGQAQEEVQQNRIWRSPDRQPAQDLMQQMRIWRSPDIWPGGQAQEEVQQNLLRRSPDRQPVAQGQDPIQQQMRVWMSPQRPAARAQNAAPETQRTRNSDLQPGGQGQDAAPKIRRRKSSDQQPRGQGQDAAPKIRRRKSSDQQPVGQGGDPTPKMRRPKGSDQHTGGQGQDAAPKIRRRKSSDQQPGEGVESTRKIRKPKSSDQQPDGQRARPKMRRPRSSDQLSGRQGQDATPKLRRPRSSDPPSGGQVQDATPKTNGSVEDRRKSFDSDQQPGPSGVAKPGTSGQKRKSDKNNDSSSDDDQSPLKVVSNTRTVATQTGARRSKNNSKGSKTSKKIKTGSTSPRQGFEITANETINRARIMRQKISEVAASQNDNNNRQENNLEPAVPNVEQPMEVDLNSTSDNENPVSGDADNRPSNRAAHPMRFSKYTSGMRKLLMLAHREAQERAIAKDRSENAQNEAGNETESPKEDNTEEETVKEAEKATDEPEQKNKRPVDVIFNSLNDSNSNANVAGPSNVQRRQIHSFFDPDYIWCRYNYGRNSANDPESANQAGSSGNTQARENKTENSTSETENEEAKVTDEAEGDKKNKDAGSQTANLYNGVPGIDEVPMVPDQEERNLSLYENRAFIQGPASARLADIEQNMNDSFNNASRAVLDAIAQADDAHRTSRCAERQRLFQFRQYRRPIVIEEFINNVCNESRNPRPSPRGVLFAGLIPTRLDHSSLVSDSSIRRFGRAAGENILYLGGGPFPARGSARPDRSNLRILSVTGFRHVTDSSLTHLASAAPHLRTLDLTGTSVSARAAQAFRVMRPDCKLITDHPVLEDLELD